MLIAVGQWLEWDHSTPHWEPLTTYNSRPSTQTCIPFSVLVTSALRLPPPVTHLTSPQMIETISVTDLSSCSIQCRAARRNRRDAMLDVYLRGDVDRISPELLFRCTRRRRSWRWRAATSRRVFAIGAQCTLVCAVGEDAEPGIKEMLRELGACRAPSFRAASTTTKTRILRDRSRSSGSTKRRTRTSGRRGRAAPGCGDRSIDAADALVLEDYNKGVLVPALITPLMQHAKSREMPTVVDPKYKNFFAYSGATIFKPNRRELESALGAAVDLEHVEALPEALKRLGVEYLLLTLASGLWRHRRRRRGG